MLTIRELLDRASTPLESVPTGGAEYQRIWRAQHALESYRRRPSQNAMLKRRAKSKGAK